VWWWCLWQLLIRLAQSCRVAEWPQCRSVRYQCELQQVKVVVAVVVRVMCIDCLYTHVLTTTEYVVSSRECRGVCPSVRCQSQSGKRLFVPSYPPPSPLSAISGFLFTISVRASIIIQGLPLRLRILMTENRVRVCERMCIKIVSQRQYTGIYGRICSITTI